MIVARYWNHGNFQPGEYNPYTPGEKTPMYHNFWSPLMYPKNGGLKKEAPALHMAIFRIYIKFVGGSASRTGVIIAHQPQTREYF